MTTKKNLPAITKLILSQRKGAEAWGEQMGLRGRPWTKKQANKFLLCCILDYQMLWETAWENGRRLAEDILHEPEELWHSITAFGEEQWRSRWNEWKTHRFPAGHQRLWRIGNRICTEYKGDARNIWKGRRADEVLDRLLALGVGEQISRMTVGGLRDMGQVHGTGDLKADVHLCRVLGRLFRGIPVQPTEAQALARSLYPSDPWLLDWPLWQLGKNTCRPTAPACDSCYLQPHCSYAASERIELPVARRVVGRTRLANVSERSKLIDGNLAFKVTWVYGRSGPFTTPCTPEGRITNIQLQKKVWCSHPECPCRVLFDRGNGGELKQAEKPPCYDSAIFTQWQFGGGFLHHGNRRGTPVPLRYAEPGKLAFFTSRNYEMSEAQRIVIGCYEIADIVEDKDWGFVVRSKPESRIRVIDLARAPKFWEYYQTPAGPRWGTGLFRYLSDEIAARLRDALLRVGLQPARAASY